MRMTVTTKRDVPVHVVRLRVDAGEVVTLKDLEERDARLSLEGRAYKEGTFEMGEGVYRLVYEDYEDNPGSYQRRNVSQQMCKVFICLFRDSSLNAEFVPTRKVPPGLDPDNFIEHKLPCGNKIVYVFAASKGDAFARVKEEYDAGRLNLEDIK
jgi:hypothetical protein